MVRLPKVTLLILLAGAVIVIGFFQPSQPVVLAQQPTGSVPTVTGTPEGPTVKVDPFNQLVRVYAGPSSFDYPAIGVLLANETAPALGRARDRVEWIQIYYPGVPGSIGWVYGPYVGLSPGAFLPLIDIPPTPTPFSTPTINPTLEAVFIGEQTPSRLQTFTPPAAPLEVPSFAEPSATGNPGVPAGLIILSLGLFGFFGAVISYLRGR
ncbi:MAG: hypothetical protein FIB03_17695 [Anaerolineae bacterium]|nr:hypothetical protein [Anaerolineae bacterium]